MSKCFNVNDLNSSGVGHGARLMAAFKAAHENVVFRNIDDLNSAPRKFTERLNNSGRDDFLGLSPCQISDVLYGQFSLDNVLFSYQSQPARAYDDVTIIKQVRHLLSKLALEGKIRLTAQGNIAPDYVKRFAEDLKDGFCFPLPARRESDVFPLTRIRTLFEILDWTQVSRGHLELTDVGVKAAQNAQTRPESLYQELLRATVAEFNWACGDELDDFPIIQDAWIFGLYLLKERAKDWVSCKELADAFVTAFPHGNSSDDDENVFERTRFGVAFQTRFLWNFCENFGLVDFAPQERFPVVHRCVRVTDLFSRCLKWKTGHPG
jgi:hypothetical protein